MAKKIHLTLACGEYEIVRALIDGSVEPEGVELTVLTDRPPDIRHWRMIRNREFDVAELSMSNYLAAKVRGQPFVAIPVFLHRRFRHSFIYTNVSKGIKKPADLIGRKVGLRNFSATANLWMRGILEHEHGVPHKKIQWFKQDDEEVEIALPKDLSLEKIPAGAEIEDMLAEGEIDALLHPELIQPILDRDPGVGGLFSHHQERGVEYFQRTGLFS